MSVKEILVVLSLIGTFSLLGQGRIEPFKDPYTTQENRLPARAVSISYPNEQLAITADRHQSPRKLSLNGNWKFNWALSPEASPSDFYKESYDHTQWDDLYVPSNWELQGYGKPWQRLTHQIWEKDGVLPPNVPADYNPTGCYIKEISLPAKWSDMQVTLHVGGATSAMYVWVNGAYVGYSEDDRLAAEWDISEYLKSGKNKVAIKVLRWSDGAYIEDQDHWRLSGIHREVYLEAAPKVQLFDFAVRTKLDEDYQDAVLQVRPEIVQYDTVDLTDWYVEVKLYDDQRTNVLPDSQYIPLESILSEHHPVLGNRSFDNLYSIKVSNPQKWTAETPSLYTVVLNLIDRDKKLRESRSCRVGFRQVEIKRGQFLVNGESVLLYGVNRHDWNPINGKAVTYEDMEQDARLMKQLNVNSSRSSHYPNNAEWYEICDRYGIYVMDEANIESHGKGSLFANAQEWNTPFMERGIRMVERNKNFPSIIMWSLGNEAGHGPNHAAIYGWIKEYDPTRPIHLETAQDLRGYYVPTPEPRDKFFTDIRSRMYRLPELMVPLASNDNDERPIIWCEYAHSQGQSTGDLESYWQTIRAYPKLIGAYVWDWRDQLVSKPGAIPLYAHGEDFEQEQADLMPVQKGLIGADGKIKSGGHHAKWVWRRVHTEAVDVANHKYRIRNDHHFTNLSAYELRYEITANGVVVKSGVLPKMDIPAGEVKVIEAALPSISYEADKTYHVKLSWHTSEKTPWADDGYEVAWDQFLLHSKAQVDLLDSSDSQVEMVEGGNDINLIVGNTKATIDKNTGLLLAYQVDNRLLISDTLKPNFWRPATDNDGASRMAERQAMWKTAFARAEVSSMSISPTEGSVSVSAKLYDANINSTLQLVYELKSSGVLDIEYHLAADPSLPNIPRVGLQTSIRKGFEEVRYFGRGPMENYSDKKNGMAFGSYHYNVYKDYEYYVRPQECGNRSDVYQLFVRDEQGYGLKAETLAQPICFSLWPYTQENIDTSFRIEELITSDYLTFNIDYGQMGVGGDNTWNLDARPHLPYRLPAGHYRYSFRLSPIEKN